MPDWLVMVAQGSWNVVLTAAPFITFGLLMAGVLYVYLPVDFVRRAMGGSGVGSILKAAAIGVPLPLCSCGVIPVALYLRKEGARRGPVLSFLISTPETGADSIAVTYALLGPVMAVARPVAAFATAVAAGIGELLFGAREPAPEAKPGAACELCAGRAELTRSHRQEGLRGAVKYAFGVLMRDLAPWLLIGLGLAGVVEGLVPGSWFEEHRLGQGVVPMLIMLAVSMPMYMCATASTPVAAALMHKGLSPGAALVFLLAGPATNVATMLAVGRFLGKRSLAIYLGSIFSMTLLLGLGLDAVVGASLPAPGGPHGHQHLLPTPLATACAVFFLLLVANGLRLRLAPYWLYRRDRQPGTANPAGQECCGPEKPGDGGSPPSPIP